MKSRKRLKKQIKKSFDELYQEVFFYEVFVVGADADAAKVLLSNMLEVETDLVKRISASEGKEVEGRVRMYFSKLRGDFRKHLTELRKSIAELTN